jgi:hypothetical protein
MSIFTKPAKPFTSIKSFKSSGYGQSDNALEYEINNNPMVNYIIQNGGTANDCVKALVRHIEQLQSQAMSLMAIVPKKIKAEDGKTYIWRCPDDMVPEIPNAFTEKDG